MARCSQYNRSGCKIVHKSFWKKIDIRFCCFCVYLFVYSMPALKSKFASSAGPLKMTENSNFFEKSASSKSRRELRRYPGNDCERSNIPKLLNTSDRSCSKLVTRAIYKTSFFNQSFGIRFVGRCGRLIFISMVWSLIRKQSISIPS